MFVTDDYRFFYVRQYRFFASVNKGSFASADPSVSVKLSMSTEFISLSTSASLLLPIILDITRFFYIGKPVTSANNTTITKILKGTIWVVGVLFLFLDKAWQYILGIPDLIDQ